MESAADAGTKDRAAPFHEASTENPRSPRLKTLSARITHLAVIDTDNEFIRFRAPRRISGRLCANPHVKRFRSTGQRKRFLRYAYTKAARPAPIHHASASQRDRTLKAGTILRALINVGRGTRAVFRHGASLPCCPIAGACMAHDSRPNARFTCETHRHFPTSASRGTRTRHAFAR